MKITMVHVLVHGTLLGALLAAGALNAAVAKDDKDDKENGLKLCQAQLKTCTVSLTSLQNQLNTCNTNLVSVNTNLGTCKSDLTSTKGQLSQCQTNLKAAQSCGNGVVNTDVGEQCDGTVFLNGTSCSTATNGAQSYGTLSCSSSCQLDTSNCNNVQFVDNQDGTVTDRKTGLQWEKKTATGCANTDVHCVDNQYKWSSIDTKPDGTAFTDFLGTLNNCQSSDNGLTVTGGFAGHCDWRLPTIVELLGIVDTAHSPNINPTFGPTQANYYWSSISLDSPSFALHVDFGNKGHVFNGKKSIVDTYVRAVRGGL